MKPTIAIGDVHGLTHWKAIVKANEDKRIVFLGDYLDPFGYIPYQALLKNLWQIIRLKMERPEQVILLLGNHDMHYFSELAGCCSRYNETISAAAGKLFREHAGCFMQAYQDGNVLFTHAGVHQRCFTENFKGTFDRPVADQLNYPLDEQRKSLFQIGYCRGGKRGDVGGPMWADLREMDDPLHGYIQVVGHTRVQEIKRCDFANGNRVYFCDSLFRGNYWDSERVLVGEE